MKPKKSPEALQPPARALGGGESYMRSLLSRIIVLVLLGATGYAQTFRGAINGTVSDASGAVVAGATVKATNVATAVPITATTTSSGEFAFQDLPLGTYKIDVTASGFRPAVIDNVTVTAGGVYTLPVKLSAGSAGTTVVEVSAAALTLDTTSVTTDSIIPDEQVQNAPMNGRDWTQFTAMAPGYAGYSGAQAFGSVNGTRANQINWQIDGVDNNDFWHNLAAVNQGGVSGIAGTLLPLDAIDEFAAQSQSNAEAGRNAGAIINVVLKSGTNQIHGSAYYFNRNTALGDASPFFNPASLQAQGLPSKKPPLRNENYGFSVGGPIIKDKAFWFVAFEKQKYTIALSGLNTEPSAAYVASAYSLLQADSIPVSSISCNLLGSGLTSSLPAGVCSPATKVALWPGFIDGLAAQGGNYFATNPSTGYSYNGVIRLDYNISEKHHLSGRWFGGQGSQTAPLGASAALATASSNDPFYFEKAPIHVFNYAITLNSGFTSKLTNQVLFGVNYFNQVFRDAVAGYDTHDNAQLFLSPDTPATPKFFGAPNIVIGSFEQVGITPPEGRNDITGMISDVLSYNTGKHQLRFGGEYRQAHLDEFYFFHSLGKFNFTGAQGLWGSCADSNVCALADFLAGFVDNSSINVGNAERKIVVNALDFYGSDAWQVTPRLNLNLGLRWDYFGPLHNDTKNLGIFIPGQGIKFQGNGIDGIFHKNLKNFSPRLGFAYRPTSREDLVVRGAFGIYFDQINVNPFLDIRPPNNADGIQDNPAGPDPVSIYTQTSAPAVGLAPNCAAHFPTCYTWQAGQNIFPGVQLCPSGNVAIDPSCGTSVFDVYSVNQNFHTAYFYSYNLNVQKSLGNGAAVWQVGYVGTEGRHLSVLLNINQKVPGAGGTVLPFGTQYPNFNNINQLNSIGTSNYNALQTTLRTRAWHGLSSNFVYTWGHNLDEITAYRGVIPFDSYNLKADYGNSDFDVRHTFVGTVSWDIPGSSRGPKALTNGWTISSILSFHGGSPSDQIRQGLDLIGDPFGGVSHSFSKSGVTWINPTAFAAPNPATCAPITSDGRCYGTMARNFIHGPGFKDVDLAVTKGFPITERVKAQLKAELFNVFNRVNLSSGSGSFGYSSGIIADTIGDFNGAPGLGPGEAFNTVLSLKITF
jgi:Carboxypeptidase regulatory-like domain/TonB dependent receptor